MSDAAKTATRQQYDKQKADRAKMTAEAHQFPTPTPTQEENDLFALGLMHPDEKQSSGEPEGEHIDDRSTRPTMPHSTAEHPPAATGDHVPPPAPRRT